MNNRYAKKNLSTKQSSPGEETRLSRENGDQERTRRFETPQSKRTQEINGSTLLDFSLPKDIRLRKRREFLRVYAEGKRFDGRLMTVFILPSDAQFQKVGITATKKAIGKAFERNRAKRLLREAFRLSKAELNKLEGKYQWVLNARRGLLHVKLQRALEDLRQIVANVEKSESKINKGEHGVAVEAQKR
jgi:ribonuclease P protein component